MTTLDASAESASEAQVEAEPAAPAGDPMMIGLPTFIVGSVALGLTLMGFVPAAAVAAPLAIILCATALGQAISAVWAAALGMSAVAGVFAIFAGFWASYTMLVLGLTNNWFGIPTAAATGTQEIFLISWIVVIGMLTLATMRLPVAYTALFALIELALVLVLIGTAQGAAGVLNIGGIVCLVFAALGVYLFFGAASGNTGGRPLPLGSPLVR